MLRLGSRPDSRRTSSPPEVSTSSFSPCTAVIAIGTSWMSSVRRCAVTCTVSSVLGACVAGACAVACSLVCAAVCAAVAVSCA